MRGYEVAVAHRRHFTERVRRLDCRQCDRARHPRVSLTGCSRPSLGLTVKTTAGFSLQAGREIIRGEFFCLPEVEDLMKPILRCLPAVRVNLMLFSVQIILLAGMGASLAMVPEPTFGWLHFGPDAKVRVLVRLNGQAVSLTEYLGGKPTDRVERFKTQDACKDVTIRDPDGKTSYVITRLNAFQAVKGGTLDLMVDVDIHGPLKYQQYCDIVGTTPSPEKAPMAHFHGPLIVEPRKIYWKLPESVNLQRGNKPSDLYANIGTMDAKRGCWVVVRTQDSKGKSIFAPDAAPFVDIEFPPKKAGGPPIKRHYDLKEVC
jgi:hypothetical protein